MFVCAHLKCNTTFKDSRIRNIWATQLAHFFLLVLQSVYEECQVNAINQIWFIPIVLSKKTGVLVLNFVYLSDSLLCVLLCIIVSSGICLSL